MKNLAVLCFVAITLILSSAAHADSYDAASNRLTISSIDILGTTYTDVVVTVANVISVGGAHPTSGTCDTVCGLMNGTSAAMATTYWRIPGLSCSQSSCFTKIAFFADGTGKLTSGTNNCLRSNVTVQPTPNVVTFNWTKAGPRALLLSNSAFTCSDSGSSMTGTVIGSFTSISDGFTSGYFDGYLNGTFGLHVTLMAGTF